MGVLIRCHHGVLENSMLPFNILYCVCARKFSQDAYCML